MARRHYHMYGYLMAGCLPDTVMTFERKRDAQDEAQAWVHDLREAGEDVRGSIRRDGLATWHGGTSYIEILACDDSDCELVDSEY